MRCVQVFAVATAVLLLQGCKTTKTIALHSETKMVVGQHMSCIYHAENLYCASALIKAEDVDKLHLMNRVVAAVHSEEKESDMKEGGAFSTRFPQKTEEYSLWNCSSTGVADPAVRCDLLRQADQELVAKQEQQIKLNESDERKLQSGLTVQDVVANCGAPIEQKDDIISHKIYFRAEEVGQNVEIRFSTLDKPMRLDQIASVQDSKSHEFVPGGIFWNNFSNIGKTDEEHTAYIRQHFPCILK